MRWDSTNTKTAQNIHNDYNLRCFHINTNRKDGFTRRLRLMSRAMIVFPSLRKNDSFDSKRPKFHTHDWLVRLMTLNFSASVLAANENFDDGSIHCFVINRQDLKSCLWFPRYCFRRRLFRFFSCASSFLRLCCKTLATNDWWPAEEENQKRNVDFFRWFFFTSVQTKSLVFEDKSRSMKIPSGSRYPKINSLYQRFTYSDGWELKSVSRFINCKRRFM